MMTVSSQAEIDKLSINTTQLIIIYNHDYINIPKKLVNLTHLTIDFGNSVFLPKELLVNLTHLTNNQNRSCNYIHDRLNIQDFYAKMNLIFNGKKIYDFTCSDLEMCKFIDACATKDLESLVPEVGYLTDEYYWSDFINDITKNMKFHSFSAFQCFFKKNINRVMFRTNDKKYYFKKNKNDMFSCNHQISSEIIKYIGSYQRNVYRYGMYTFYKDMTITLSKYILQHGMSYINSYDKVVSVEEYRESPGETVFNIFPHKLKKPYASKKEYVPKKEDNESKEIAELKMQLQAQKEIFELKLEKELFELKLEKELFELKLEKKLREEEAAKNEIKVEVEVKVKSSVELLNGRKPCLSGSKCKNAKEGKCKFGHLPSEMLCKFSSNCTKLRCEFWHPV